MSFTTASTSVVLVPTATSNAPFFIYLNNVSTTGRIVTVRDNDGYASISNQIVIAPRNGAYFTDGTSSITINQPYGYVTLNTAVNGGYGVLNTFGFPAGSAAAFVSNVTSCNFTTSTIGAQYISAPTGVFNLINTNTISATTILVNSFTPNSVEANTISTGAITGGSLSFQTIFGSTITTNNLSFPSLTVANANFTNITVSNTTTTSNVAFVGDVIVYGTSARTSIGTSNTIATTATVIGSNAAGGVNSVAIGVHANSSGSGLNATSVGFGAGRYTQGNNTVAIGNLAGNSNQGSNAIAIGNLAGQTNQSTNTIVLNASDSALNTSTSSAFYVSPIRNIPTGSATRVFMYYDNVTKEVTTGPVYLSTNNVGISIANPRYTLDVNGETHSENSLLVGNTSNNSGTLRITTSAGDCYIQPGSNEISGSGSRLRFATMKNTTTTMTVNVSTQQVGIGTITPLTPLHVQAAIPLAEPYAHILVEGTAATPNAALAFSNATGWARMGVAGGTNQYATGSLIGDLVVTTQTTNKKMMFVNQSGTGMTLSNNFLGIGTTSPAYTLDVGGTINARTLVLSSNGSYRGVDVSFYVVNGARAPLLTTNEGITGMYLYRIANNTEAIQMITKSGIGTSSIAMTIREDGKVGIGTTSPVYELDVVGSSRVTTQQFIGFSNSNTGTLRLFASGGSNYIQSGSNNTSGSGNTIIFGTINNTTQTMTINTSTQRVGIGTTTPAARLDISNDSTTYAIHRGTADNTVGSNFLKTLTGPVSALPVAMAGAGTSLYFYYRNGANSSYYSAIAASGTLFTGQHLNEYSQTSITMSTVKDYTGLIVSATDEGYVSYMPDGTRIFGKEAIWTTEALPTVKLADKDMDKAIWGVITNHKNDNYTPEGTRQLDNQDEWNIEHTPRIRVNGLGEGAIWVTNINGNLENGDFICSSVIPGYGRKQDDDILHNYTVAKITTSCSFEFDHFNYRCEEFQYEGQTYRRAYVGCTYHCS